MTINKPINLTDVAGGRSPTLIRRQIFNELNKTSTRDIISGPRRVRTIDITSPGGRVQQRAFYDNRTTGGNQWKRPVGYGAATILGIAGSLAATDAAGWTHVYGDTINKED